jgi:CBS-domain-containing membrane protein
MTLDPTKITARQIMDHAVLTLNQDTSVRIALAALDQHRVAGAPVVNDSDECLGDFSGVEAVKRIAAVAAAEVPWGLGGASSALANDGPEAVTLTAEADTCGANEVLTEESVEHWMDTEPRWVSPETTVEEVCRRMAREGLKQVLVLEGKRLRGIISSHDVVRLVAGLKAAESSRNGNGNGYSNGNGHSNGNGNGNGK